MLNRLTNLFDSIFARPTHLMALMLMLVLSCLAFMPLTGCSLPAETVKPVQTAQTPEQRAYAAYGTWVIYKELGAKLIQDPAVPDGAKLTIQSIDTNGSPVADTVLGTARQIMETRAVIAAAEAAALESGDMSETEARLVALTSTINTELPKLTGWIGQLRDAVD